MVAQLSIPSWVFVTLESIVELHNSYRQLSVPLSIKFIQFKHTSIYLDSTSLNPRSTIRCLITVVSNLSSVFDSVVADTFQITFRTKMHVNDVFFIF